MALHFIGSDDQVADIFTKGLPISRFVFLKSKHMVSSPLMSLKGVLKRSRDVT